MKLSVVILNYKVRYFLELCLKSVKKATAGIDSEIIVIDNNSADGSVDMIKALFPEIILIENKDNLGFSKANNQGAAKAKGEYICILNPDTVVAEDTFKKLLNFADSKEKVGIIGCKLINGVGQFLPESKRNIPRPLVSLNKILGNSEKYYANHVNENETGQVDILVGAFMLVKQSVFNQVKGFDEDYFMYGEDIDISYKVLKAGYTNYYFGDSTIIHFKGESTLKDKKYIDHFYEAMKIFYSKHFKKYMVFDFTVRTGIKVAKLFRKEQFEQINVPERFVLISDQSHVKLMSVLSKPVAWNSNVDALAHGSEIIFDAGFMSFKEIIEKISKLKKNQGLTFKILPKNSNFIIGSNSAKSRGEIIKF